MATSKKPAAKKAAPVKRVYKKRTPKAEAHAISHVEPVIDNQEVIEEGNKTHASPHVKRTVKEWITANKWYLIGAVAIILLGIWLYYDLTSAENIGKKQEKKDVKYEQLEKRFDSLLKAKETSGRIATEEREEAEVLENEAEEESRQAVETAKKKEKETTVNYKKDKLIIYDKSTTQHVRDSLRDAKLRAIERLKGENR